jgi:hypothetical protein
MVTVEVLLLIFENAGIGSAAGTVETTDHVPIPGAAGDASIVAVNPSTAEHKA